MPFNLKEMRWTRNTETYQPLALGEKAGRQSDAISDYSAETSVEDQKDLTSCNQCSMPPSRTLRSRIYDIGFVCGGGILLVLLGLLVGLLASRPPQLPYPDIHNSDVQTNFRTSRPWNASSPSPCGDTIESARAAGCQWSSMIWAWFPPACYDWDLEEQFLKEEDWEWFSTRELRPDSKLSRDAILRGDHTKAYVTGHYHKYHCAYAFKKLFRSTLGYTVGDNYMLTSMHMHHCSGNFLLDGWGTTAGVAKWLDCVHI
ncbi:hypothetical protein MMC25_008160 [Agyrium rufum]|nr:hypothetical protein [Agyrium rufum]